MSKARWKKLVCDCTICTRCKDRERQEKKRLGTWTPYKARGRKREREAHGRKMAKIALKAVKEADAKALQKRKKEKQEFRFLRGEAFKKNVRIRGLLKAKYQAACITKKINKTWRMTDADRERAALWRKDGKEICRFTYSSR